MVGLLKTRETSRTYLVWVTTVLSDWSWTTGETWRSEVEPGLRVRRNNGKIPRRRFWLNPPSLVDQLHPFRHPTLMRLRHRVVSLWRLEVERVVKRSEISRRSRTCRPRFNVPFTKALETTERVYSHTLDRGQSSRFCVGRLTRSHLLYSHRSKGKDCR